ncbi:MAG: Spy/CpxP family protein refolding chaperone [bacterium]
MKKIITGILIAGLLVSLGVGLTWAANNPQTATSNTQTNSSIQQGTTTTSTTSCPGFFGRGMRRLGKLEQGAATLEQKAANLQEKLITQLKEKLGLTDDQVSQIKAAVQSAQDTMKNLQTQLKTARQNLIDALKTNPTDTVKLAQAQETIASLQKQILDNQVQTALKIKEIVGPDKFSQLGNCFGPFFGPRLFGK